MLKNVKETFTTSSRVERCKLGVEGKIASKCTEDRGKQSIELLRHRSDLIELHLLSRFVNLFEPDVERVLPCLSLYRLLKMTLLELGSEEGGKKEREEARLFSRNLES